MYFKVIKGSQSGAEIKIPPHKTYHVANDFAADIYLQQAPDSTLSFDLINHDNEVIFQQIKGGNLTLINQHHQLQTIVMEQGYALPLRILINEQIEISLAESSDQHDWLEAQTNINFDQDLTPELAAAGIIPPPPAAEHATTPVAKNWHQQLQQQLQVVASKLTQAILILHQTLYQRLGNLAYVIYAMLAGIIITSATITYQAINQEHLEYKLSHNFEQRQKLQKILLELPSKYSDLKLQQQENQIEISGLVYDQNDLDYLQAKLKPYAAKINYKVLLFTNLQAPLYSLLNQYNFIQAHVHFIAENSSIAISGIVTNLENVHDIEIAINNKFGDLGQIDTGRVFQLKDIEQQLGKLINPNANQLNLETHYAQGIINISGFLSDPESANIAAKAIQFNQEYAGVVKLNLNIQDTLKAMPFMIREVYTGSPGWIVTDNGIKIYEGGSYKDLILHSIDDQKIVFMGKFKFSIPLEDLMSPSFRQQAAERHDQSDSASQDCGRSCIIHQELAHESHLIEQEQQQLASFHHILEQTKDSNLKYSLATSIHNLESDLSYRQHGFQLAKQEEQNELNRK